MSAETNTWLNHNVALIKVWELQYMLRTWGDYHIKTTHDSVRIQSLQKSGPVVQEGFDLSEKLGAKVRTIVTNNGERWFEAPLQSIATPRLHIDIPEEIRAFHLQLHLLYEGAVTVHYKSDASMLRYVVLVTPNATACEQVRETLLMPRGRVLVLGSRGQSLWVQESDIMVYGRSLL